MVVGMHVPRPLRQVPTLFTCATNSELFNAMALSSFLAPRITPIRLIRFASSASSKQWVARQSRDPFVAQRNEDSFRSRSAYKLQEIDQKYKIFSGGKTVIDLGAAPGGWSEYAAHAMRRYPSQDKSKGSKGAPSLVYAVDLLPIEPLSGVTAIKGDFLSQEVYERLQAKLLLQPAKETAGPTYRDVDIVLSDMRANTSGQRDSDITSSLELCMAALTFAQRAFSVTIPKGPGRGSRKYLMCVLPFLIFLSCCVLMSLFNRMKFFTDPEFDAFRKTCARFFNRVEVFKPKASRSESSEMYLVCSDYHDDGELPSIINLNPDRTHGSHYRLCGYSIRCTHRITLTLSSSLHHPTTTSSSYHDHQRKSLSSAAFREPLEPERNRSSKHWL